MLHEHYLDLMHDVADLIAELCDGPDVPHGERVATLLQRLDLVHREALMRLIEALRAAGAGDAVDRAIADDPTVRLLLGLYDLADLPASTPQSQGFFPIERLAVHRSTTAIDDVAGTDRSS